MDGMEARRKPLDVLAEALSKDMAAVNTLIRARMASEHAPRIPQVRSEETRLNSSHQ